MERATLGSPDDSCKFADTSLSLSLPDLHDSEVQARSWKKSFDPCSSDLFPRIRLSLCPGRLPGAAAGVSAPYHGCYHTRDCTDLSVQGRASLGKAISNILLLPSIFTRETTTIQGRGARSEMKAPACSPVSPEFA